MTHSSLRRVTTGAHLNVASETTPLLDREEYIEQAYFFRVYRERLDDNSPAQEILTSIHEEILSTTKLPMALEFLSGEVILNGRISDGMALLSHYFTPFQTFVMTQSEEVRSRFDHKVALEILEREALYRSEKVTQAGLFIFQFECVARNRLGYDHGMTAMAGDPMFDERWQEWILKLRHQLGTTDFGDLLYARSEYAVEEHIRSSGDEDFKAPYPILFGTKEGRIAKANRGKDPLFMFAALQRQLDYPAVPRTLPADEGPIIHPALEQRLQRIEKRLQLLEMEAKGGIDLTEFYVKPEDFKANDDPADEIQ